ncbi:MAG: phosphatidate cytidylyltransferase [Lachnospiraceae bacterium]
MFKTRLISGIVLIVLALLTIISGGTILWITLLALSIIGMQEFYAAVKVRDGQFNLLELAGYFCAIFYYVSLYVFQVTSLWVTCAVPLLVLFAVYVFSYPKYSISQVAMSYFGFVYVAIMMSFIFALRTHGGGVFLVWLIFISAWGCDTLAYCTGTLFGKHKMSPVLSPKKSIEGAIGGVLGAAALGAAYAVILNANHLMRIEKPWLYALICGIGALVSMVGDLSASAIKRQSGIKDFGNLIPGHGGILDRFDSVIFVAPILYFLATGMF